MPELARALALTLALALVPQLVPELVPPSVLTQALQKRVPEQQLLEQALVAVSAMVLVVVSAGTGVLMLVLVVVPRPGLRLTGLGMIARLLSGPVRQLATSLVVAVVPVTKWLQDLVRDRHQRSPRRHLSRQAWSMPPTSATCQHHRPHHPLRQPALCRPHRQMCPQHLLHRLHLCLHHVSIGRR